MRRPAAGGIAVIALACAVAPSACGGASVDSRSHDDGVAGAGGSGAGGQFAASGADGSGARPAKVSAGGRSLDGGAGGRPLAVPDGALLWDGGPDPCLDPTGTVCQGDTLWTCVGGQGIGTDCTTFLLDSTYPVSTICTRFPDGSRCTARTGDTCFTGKGGGALLLPCTGVEPGCVIYDNQRSACVEHLGTCDDQGAIAKRCAGTVRLYECAGERQPSGYDCATSSRESTCAWDGTSSWCEGVGVGGVCDADSTSGPDGGSGNLRCAPGLTCVREAGKAALRGYCG